MTTITDIALATDRVASRASRMEDRHALHAASTALLRADGDLISLRAAVRSLADEYNLRSREWFASWELDGSVDDRDLSERYSEVAAQLRDLLD